MNTRYSRKSCFLNPVKMGQRILTLSLLTASVQAVLADDNAFALEADTLVCYAVADNSQVAGSKDTLVRFSTDNGSTTAIGMTTTSGTEAVTFNVAGNILYATNGRFFGTLDFTGAGEFDAIGVMGIANGVDGLVELRDVDGLAFDYATGILYATLRREHQNPPQYDLLFQINPNTGAFIPNAFGNGLDYVPLIPPDTDKYDVDDIASDPETGTLYGVANEGVGRNTILIQIDNLTGAVTKLGDIVIEIDGEIQTLHDVEGLTVDQFGTLYGSTGRGRSLGEGGDETRNRLYQLEKPLAPTTEIMATVIGGLTPENDVAEANQDFEALACLASRGSCVMYALHDESRADSQVFEIRPFENNGAGIITPVGPLRKDLDIEGLAILDGVLYGSSGTDGGRKRAPNGTIYEIHRISGELTDLGLTGSKEISSFALNPVDGTLWGWARGNKSSDYVGPIKVDDPTVSGVSTEQAPGVFDRNSPPIEAIAWSNDGEVLYATSYNKRNTDTGSRSYTTLWGYDPDTQNLSVVCKDLIKANVEAMENQPNDLLVLGIDGTNEMGIVAVDTTACEIVASRTYTNVPYDDIESIEWPAAECQGLSWLYDESGFAEISFITYDAVPEEAEEALRLALEKIFTEFTIENDDGHLTVYVGDTDTYKVYPEPLDTRSGLRSGEDEEIITAELDLATGVIEAVDTTGAFWTFYLEPVASDESDLVETLSSLGEVSVEDGLVSVEVDGVMVNGVLDIKVEEAEVMDGQPLLPAVSTMTAIGDVNGDGIEDYEFTYLDGSTQKLFGRN